LKKRVISRRFLVAFCLVTCSFGAAGCGTSRSSAPTVTASENVGPAGGRIEASGVVVDFPPGALLSPTSITVTEDPNGVPPPYVALSPLFHFAPDGLTFAKPVTVTFSASSHAPTASVYWSVPAGSAYAALPTTWTGASATASVEHFSSGFVGVLPEGSATDAGGADEDGAPDATVPDGGATDATLLDDATSDATSPADGGTPEDATLSDAGSTYVYGEIDGLVTGTTVTISADEFSSVPGSDGGCTGQIPTGHQQVTIPSSALPYIYRFYFPDGPTSTCTARSYAINVIESAEDGGVLASGSGGCATTAGASIYCGSMGASLLPTDAGAADASDSSTADAGGAGVDAGDAWTSPITFSGTISGTVPPGASWIHVQFTYSYHLYATMGTSQLTCSTPTNPTYTADLNLLPTLPATYSIPVGYDSPDGGPNFCNAGFEVEAYATDASGIQLTGASTGTSQCGCVGGCPTPPGYGYGAPAIGSTAVTCNVAIP
jgi:hypothetical protein